MPKCVLFLMSVALLASCGAPAGDVVAATGAVSEVRGDDGVLRRISAGSEGHASDLEFFRQKLKTLEASSRPDERLIVGVAGIVDHLERLVVEKGDPDVQPSAYSSGYLCGGSYVLVANVSHGWGGGSSSAQSSYTEFGPLSPWTKTLNAYAYTWNGSYGPTDSQSGTFHGAATFSVSASAAVAPGVCYELLAYASYNGDGCSGGFRSVYESAFTCP